MPPGKSKPRRYSQEREWYERKLQKVMAEFGLTPEMWNLRYDRWEGAALDFTYKGVTRRFERLIDKQTIHYASDCVAQIALGMERLLWLKREGIFDLDVLTAGLPQLPPPVQQCFIDMGFATIPANTDEINERFRELAKKTHPDGGGSADAFQKLQKARTEALKFFEKEKAPASPGAPT